MRKIAVVMMLAAAAFATTTNKGMRAKVYTTQGGHSVGLSWGASGSQGVTSYNVYRALTAGGEIMGQPLYTGIPCCSFTDTNVSASTTYYYKATAVCSSCSPSESVFSNEVSATIPPDGQPQPPTNLTVTTIAKKTGGYKDVLAWQASLTQGVVYRVYRGGTSGGPYTQIAGSITKLTYTDNIVSTGTYYYVAAAYVKLTKQLSGYSNEAKAVVP